MSVTLWRKQERKEKGGGSDELPQMETHVEASQRRDSLGHSGCKVGRGGGTDVQKKEGWRKEPEAQGK